MVVVAAVSLSLASPAGAQTSCDASPTYNPSAGVGANPTMVVVGGGTTITGTGFAPGCEVTITITDPNGVTVATVTVITDANGSFTTTINTTNYALGTYTATAVQGSLSLSTSFTVVGAAVTTVPSNLPVTGSSSTGAMVQGALVLLVLGGLVLLVARKRKDVLVNS